MLNIPGLKVEKFEPEPTFETVIRDARCIAFDDTAAITRICAATANLSPIEKEQVLQELRRITGLSIKTLRQQVEAGESRNEPDQLELAHKTIAAVGAGNILHVNQFTWKFSSSGVWQRCDDREVKQDVQLTLVREGVAVTSMRVNGIAEVLKNEIFRPRHEFNLGNPESVNCTNCELELINGQWFPHLHRRELYRTTQIPVRFDPNATAPIFLQFLDDIFRDDPDKDAKKSVVLEMMGYSLMGHSNREKFVLLIGAGANGKSVLLSTLEALLGKMNVAGVQPSNFDNNFQMGHLDQKLANIVTELKQGETIADSKLKAITSGELTTVEHKNKNPFDIRPFATCWFGTNHMPHTRDYSDAFFRRAIVVTFNRVFKPHEQDPDLKRRIAGELPGILNLALIAYANVVARNGFSIPQSSIDAQRKWQTEANQVAQFVEERCTVRPDARSTIEGLYMAYQDWARGSGIRQVLGKLHFGDRLEQLGYVRVKGTGGIRLISGLSTAPHYSP